VRDTSHLSDTEKKIDYLMEVMDENDTREMARLGMLLHVVYGDTMSSSARHTFDDVLRGIGPDFLLTFRALRALARHTINKRPNWRRRA
jgi:hypothetical protein